MNTKFLPLSLTFEYFGAGPGAGGIAKLSVLKRDGEITVKAWENTADREAESQVVAMLPSSANWRDVVRAIVEESCSAFHSDGDLDGEFAWPELMTIKGPENHATDLIACAWAGDPLSGIAESLAVASDEQLSSLRENIGSLSGERFLKRMLRIQSVSEEFDFRLSDVIVLSENQPLNTWQLWKCVKQFAQEKRLQRAGNEAIVERALSPFRHEITRIIEDWQKLNLASSMTTSMLVSAQRNALERFIQEYVLRHRKLPRGVATLTVGAFSRPINFSVDFDLLQQHTPKESN